MTTTSLHRPALPEWPRRLLAAGAAVLVLTLSVLATCPQLHQWLHPDADHSDHECAITLFHHGVTQAVVGVALVVIPLLPVARVDMAPAGPDLIAPRYRLSPGRAPPGC
jgi:heme A synthase